jgi:hypothetical protein
LDHFLSREFCLIIVLLGIDFVAQAATTLSPMPYFVASYTWNRVTNLEEIPVRESREAVHVHYTGMLISATIFAATPDEAKLKAEAIAQQYQQKMQAKDAF